MDAPLTRESSPAQPGPHGDERRGWLGYALARLLGPLYYWLDLYDANRRPNHSKIKTTAALGVAVGITVGVAIHVFRAHQGDLEPDELLSLFGFVVLILFASYGLAGLKVWAATKGGGTVPELGAAAARTAIAARRQAAQGDHEPSP